MTGSVQHPGPARSGAFGVAIIVAGIVLAAWVAGGRALFGIAGGLTPVYICTLGFAIAVLHFFIGLAFMRAAKLGHRIRPITIVQLAFSWACGLLLGLTIPDVTDAGLQTIVSGATEPGLSIAVGVANPLGIICLGTAIAALVLAGRDARGIRPVIEEDY